MLIISVLVWLAVFGALLYLLELIPMDAAIRQVVRVVAIIAIVLWVLGRLMPAVGGMSL